MSELTLTIVRLGLLALLWVFVFSVVGVLRGDLFGTKVTGRVARPGRGGSVPASVDQPAPARGNRRTPTHLLVTGGPLEGARVTLSQQSVLIGRSPEATLVLSDDYVSGRHARIYPEGDAWYVEDLGSTNGTYAGKQRLTHPVKLKVGSTLRIGTTVLELRR
ncbi:MAG: FHA domain-containing protein FhaB/FipA [Angustibacter sp.]